MAGFVFEYAIYFQVLLLVVFGVSVAKLYNLLNNDGFVINKSKKVTIYVLTTLFSLVMLFYTEYNVPKQKMHINVPNVERPATSTEINTPNPRTEHLEGITPVQR